MDGIGDAWMCLIRITQITNAMKSFRFLDFEEKKEGRSHELEGGRAGIEAPLYTRLRRRLQRQDRPASQSTAILCSASTQLAPSLYSGVGTLGKGVLGTYM